MKELSDKSKPQSLEELFRVRMEAAEEMPSDRVWERIEQGLNLKEAAYYKKRVSWYKSLAAACIVLVLCAAMYLYYDINTQHSKGEGNLASHSQNQQNTVPGNKTNHLPANGGLLKETNKDLDVGTSATVTAKATISASTKLADSQSVSKNLAPDNFNAKSSPATKNFTSRQVLAKTALPKDKKISYQTGALATGAAKHSRTENRELGQAGVITWANQNKLGSAKIQVAAAGLDPLVPVTIGVGVSKFVPAADSLWKPRAIEAAPPALAWGPNPNPEPEKPWLSRWSFSARYAPQYFNQNIELASVTPSQNAMVPGGGSFNTAPASLVNTGAYTEALIEFDRSAASGFSYNTAATVGYALTEHWSLESGILFTQNVANSKSSYVFSNSYLAARYNNSASSANLKESRNLVQAAYLPTTALVASLSGQQNLNTSAVIQTPTFETEYRYRSVGVPVKLNYQTTSRKSFYFASVGLLTNLLIQAQVISESNRVPDIKFGSNPDSPFRSWQFATILSAGKGFRVSKALSLRAGIEGTQYLTSLAAHPENLERKQRKPYTIGVAFSSSYTLGQ